VPLYGVLIVPWPGVRDLYASYFRGFNGALLSKNNGNQLVRFEKAAPPAALDTAIEVAGRADRDADGRLHGLMLAMDSRGVGWIPTALALALILSTPVPWRRRIKALAPGMAAVHAYIVVTVWIFVWNESNGAGVRAASMQMPVWHRITDGLEEALVTQVGASVVIPVVVWFFVMFSKQDLERVRDAVRPLGGGIRPSRPSERIRQHE
jgi:hypothetical protein